MSQACPLRRVHVDRNLSLYAPKAWASGGYLADVQVDGYTMLGGQPLVFSSKIEHDRGPETKT